MITKFLHLNIISQNWELLAQFYQDALQCVPISPRREWSGDWYSRATGVKNASVQGIHLRLPGYGEDGPTLEIFQYNQMEEKRPTAANRSGFAHIAFLVDDVVKVRHAILQHGGRDVGKLTHTGISGEGKLTFIYMADPEGNIIEILHWGKVGQP